MARLFFALWPTPEDCEELLRRGKPWLSKANGRAVSRENLHITLAFLGNVNGEQQDCLADYVAQIDIPSFTLCLEQLAYWPKPQVVWAGPVHTPEAFGALARAIKTGAQTCGLSPDMRAAMAHLTLKRKVTRAAPMQTITPLCWQVTRFYLVKSTTYASGPVYERVQHWPLGEL